LNSKTKIITIAVVVIAVVFLLAILSASTAPQSNNNLATGQATNSGNLESEVQALQSEVQNLQNIVSLQDSDTLVQNQPVNEGPGGSYYFSFTANYAGYVVIDVTSSTTSNTWVQIEVNNPSTGTIESQQYTVGYSGTVYFPVLPGTVTIYIGNSNLVNGASQTVSITYIY